MKMDMLHDPFTSVCADSEDRIAQDRPESQTCFLLCPVYDRPLGTAYAVKCPMKKTTPLARGPLSLRIPTKPLSHTYGHDLANQPIRRLPPFHILRFLPTQPFHRMHAQGETPTRVDFSFFKHILGPKSAIAPQHAYRLDGCGNHIYMYSAHIIELITFT
ncbi:hypothetical protein BC827DRAFT_115979 [Russula dissimulans]|nr:hypothetical protein BC827DRAFT_115979 [Russula dissimulans]